MADCGASGTTLDRVTRSVLGSSSRQQQDTVSKHVGTLLNHMTIASQPVGARGKLLPTGAPMPTTAPDHLLLPMQNTTDQQVSNSISGATANMPPTTASAYRSVPASSMDGVWNTHAPPPHLHHHGPLPPPQLMHPQHASMFHHQQQQQQQYAMQAMMHHEQQRQQQQMMMMQQQLQHQQHQNMILAQKNQQIQQSQQNTKSDVGDVNGNTMNHGERVENMQENLGHEGYVQNASIEELASAWADASENDKGLSTTEELEAAWAQAEAEYEAIIDSGDPTDLWASETAQPTPYEFVHKDEVPKEMLDWMKEGMKHFKEGDLQNAIKCFEMELQHSNPDNSVAWRMLGRCHAENDQDPEAIQCLEAAVDRDPFSPESLLALGVSYVNELNHERALANLKAWLTHNPTYADMELPEDILGSASSSSSSPSRQVSGESAFEEVKRMLLLALDFDSTNASEVYEALGVVYNVNKDYDAAVDSFRKAIELRPNDYQLWNKLGATLANGNQSEQALPNYHKALQIKPKYARAWLNMAISHSNLQSHNEASRCYLQTLSLNPAAQHCWQYLRMSLSCAERWELMPLVFSRDIKGFKSHFDFVTYDS